MERSIDTARCAVNMILHTHGRSGQSVVGMKLNKRTMSTLLVLLFLFITVGTLSWELLERILATTGLRIDWSVGPIGFDLRVLALTMQLNPGSLAGILVAFRTFKSA